MNRYFLKEDIYVVKRYMKKCLLLLVIREIEIKFIMRYYFILIRMVIKL